MPRIAQISDLHVRRSNDTKATEFDTRLLECIARVNAVAPDVVIVTGDLTHTGSEQEYSRLRELMQAFEHPYYLMPGNHDDPVALRRVFEDRAYLFQSNGHVSYAVEMGNWALLMLDSTKRGRAGGYMDTPRLSWLSSQLRKRSDAPVFLALHHRRLLPGFGQWTGSDLPICTNSKTRCDRMRTSGRSPCDCWSALDGRRPKCITSAPAF